MKLINWLYRHLYFRWRYSATFRFEKSRLIPKDTTPGLYDPDEVFFSPCSMPPGFAIAPSVMEAKTVRIQMIGFSVNE